MEIQKFLKLSDIDVNNHNTPYNIIQYFNFKKEYSNFILFMRVGDFYETYFEDAVTFSKACSITLTKKTFKIGNIQMAGVNKNSINKYLEKMLEQGFKVAISEQTDDCTEDGRIVRKLSKTFTKGCLVDLEFLNPNENNYLVSIFKKNDIFQIAYTDISTGEIFYSEGMKFEIECELARLKPKEILIPYDFEVDFLDEFYSFEKLNTNFYEGESDNLALCGLINYAKFVLLDFYPKFEDVKKYNIKKLLLMDYQTRKNLELTENSYNFNIKGSLLYVLDTCKTPMGKRLLRSIISTPLYDLSEIKKRQESILKLQKNYKIRDRIDNLLENIGDISRLSSHMSNSSISPMEFVTVKRGLSIYKELIDIKNELNLKWLNYYNFENEDLLSDFSSILDRTLTDDIELIKNNDYIKEGANSELDYVKDELKNALDELKNYEELLILKTGIKSLKIIRTQGQYVISINSNSINPKGDDFVVLRREKNTIKYTTNSLLELEKRILSKEAKIREISNNIFKNLKEFSKEMAPYLRKYSKIIGVLDVLSTLVKANKENNLIEPNISAENNFKILGIGNLAAEKYINNYEKVDFDFSKNHIILTGKNGIGKSTLLKSIGVILCLAQTGSFVPLKSANLPLVDRIFSILNVGDEVINKKSTHQRQMHLVSKAFENITNKSVILFDEIGKHTNNKDGLSLSVAILNYAKSIDAKYVFSTHFLEIAKYLDDKDFDFYQLINENQKRKLNKGTIEESKGIDTAKFENLPDCIIENAKKIYDIL